MTVREALDWGAGRLEAAGVPEARHDASVLLGQILGRPRLELPLHYTRRLTGDEDEAYRRLIDRRARREPLQHILGFEGFMGLEFRVDRRVLIPRPETEVLAERAMELAQTIKTRASAGGPSRPLRVADVGTGSGCLAVTLARRLPEAEVWATDSSTDALELARFNAARNGVEGRVHFLAGDLVVPLVARGLSVDLLISNPPYIPSAEIQTLQEEVRGFEPRTALDGGPDGLDAYRALISGAGRVLADPGQFGDFGGDGSRRPDEGVELSPPARAEANRSDLDDLTRQRR